MRVRMLVYELLLRLDERQKASDIMDTTDGVERRIPNPMILYLAGWTSFF